MTEQEIIATYFKRLILLCDIILNCFHSFVNYCSQDLISKFIIQLYV